MKNGKKWPRWLGWGLAVLVAGLGIGALARAQPLPSGPEPIAWDREACAHCRMQVGEPRFAAQLQTEEGRTLNFDDVGCLLKFLEAEHPRVHATYVHHFQQDRWLPLQGAGFIEVGRTPMGYDLGAVDADAPGAHDLPWARAHVGVAEAVRNAGGS